VKLYIQMVRFPLSDVSNALNDLNIWNVLNALNGSNDLNDLNTLNVFYRPNSFRDRTLLRDTK